MTSAKSFELIARYIVAANDVIDVCGPDAIDPLRVLLKAAHDEAVLGKMKAGPGLHAAQIHRSERPDRSDMSLN